MKLVKKKIILSLLIAVFVTPNLNANNGQDLFKQNCAACHKLEGALVGPGLKGVSAKWQGAGEATNLIEWVKNSRALFESGKSEMAKVAWEISPIEMAPMPSLNDEQIRAIFDFIDSEATPEPLAKANEGETAKTIKIADSVAEKGKRIYTQEEAIAIQKEKNDLNIKVFFILLLLALCLLAGIVSISKTIETFILLKIKEGESPKNKKSSKNGNVIASVALIIILSIPFNGFSLSFNSNDVSWLTVSDFDNIVLFGINLLLFWILIDHKKTLNAVIAQYDTNLLKKKTKDKKRAKEESITKILTGAVALEDEATILLDHDFDGIRELDNNLPPWWVWGFVASIVFAFFYLIHYHVTKTGDLQIAEYDKSVAAAQIEIDEYMSTMAMNVDENNVVILTESTDINNGKALFTTNCIVCHKENGEGLIGPNLTDKFWLIGNGSINDVFKVIKYGTTNGMPEHQSKMNPIELQQVASFVLQLEYKEGKAPEGDEIK
jgi:cytochrome c oxidase cbb3-type subunit 3